MYMRTISRKNKDGSKVDYIQLAHNVRDPEKGYSKAEVIHSFGRRDELDVEAIRRLVKSMSRFLDPEEAIKAQGEADAPAQYKKSWQAGGPLVLRAIWHRLHIKEALNKALKGRNFTTEVEKAIFAMVANRALAPSSKLHIEKWAKDAVALGNTEPLQVHHFYRGMDFLLEHSEAIQKEVFWTTANLLNLQVDLLFFDTTNIYFEIDDPGDSELKHRGHSKEKRDDLPLVTIGLAVTRNGIPVKCWVLPGNQHDATTVEQVQAELNGWRLGRVVWVMDRGMTSEENKRILQQAGGDYILGEKLRGNKDSEAALRRGGRFKEVKDNLRIKEVTLGQGATKRRYVILYNPDEAKKDKATREKMISRITQELQTIETLPSEKQAEARTKLLAHKSLGRYVKELKSGQVKLDQAKIKDDAKLDGKHLVSSSNEELSAEDLALGYKQLLDVERAFRTMKTSLEVRPVYHQRDDRIRSHVLLCWLALLLIRVAETKTGQTWDQVRYEMEQLRLGEFLTEKHRYLQHTALTAKQRSILKKLKIKPPRTIKTIEDRA